MGHSGDVGGAAAYPQSSQATAALVLGILGFVCCQLLAPVAWYVGQQELSNVEAGRVPPDNEGLARAGQVLGIIGTVLLGLGILILVVFAPFAMVFG